MDLGWLMVALTHNSRSAIFSTAIWGAAVTSATNAATRKAVARISGVLWWFRGVELGECELGKKVANSVVHHVKS